MERNLFHPANRRCCQICLASSSLYNFQTFATITEKKVMDDTLDAFEILPTTIATN
jgi:hypothetical protein